MVNFPVIFPVKYTVNQWSIFRSIIRQKEVVFLGRIGKRQEDRSHPPGVLFPAKDEGELGKNQQICVARLRSSPEVVKEVNGLFLSNYPFHLLSQSTMNSSLKISLSFLYLYLCLGFLQINAQNQGFLWVGSRSTVTIPIPVPLQGSLSSTTLTESTDFEQDGLQGSLTLKFNPDGKIVSLTVATDTPDRVNVRCLEGHYADLIGISAALDPNGESYTRHVLHIIEPDIAHPLIGKKE